MIKSPRLLSLTVVLTFVLTLNQTTAQQAPAKVPQNRSTSKPSTAKPSFPKFEDITKDMTSQKGLFTFWSYPSGAKDRDEQTLLAEIPKSMMGQKFMLSTSFSGGGAFTGFPIDERVVQWEMQGKQLILVEPETRFIANSKETVSDVVRRTYPDRIRAAVPIVTKSSSGSPLIDLGSLLKSDFADIGWLSRGRSGVNRSLSKWTKKKTFELNVEIGVELAVSSSSPPGSYEKKMVHFSFWKLPKSTYKPRIADDRVGYFITANQDWAKPTDARDIFNRYINRWSLEKRDPSLKVCEPKQPIIFYIEKTVPVRFRKAVRDGILEWNKAFEKIGFVGAVQVRQQTDDNEWKDLDPEDMRYSFFRWIVSGRSFAMGPSRANPFTGQIHDADIIFDDSMVRVYEDEVREMLPSTLVAQKFRDPALRAFLEKHPQWKKPTREWESVVFGKVEDDALREAMRQRLWARGQQGCDYAEGMKHQLAIGRAMLAGSPEETFEKFINDIIKEIVMHEVGHTIGLRHNFKASSIYSLEEVNRRRLSGQATVGSVMDYNPALFFAERRREGDFITPTIGPYDYWAVEYGYRPADGTYKRKQDNKPGTQQGTADKPKPTNQAKPDDIPEDVVAKLPDDVKAFIAGRAAKKKKESESKKASEQEEAAPRKSSAKASPEEAMLRAIASRANEPELAYATDEDTTGLGPDPRANRYDMGRNPIEWAELRIKLVDQRLNNILDWAVKEKESWYHLRRAFSRLLFEKAAVLDYVGRYIGGQYTSRSHRGDPNGQAPFAIVPPKTQRDALAFIEKHVFTDEFFTFPPELLNHLATPRWRHGGASLSYTMDFPIHEQIAMLQWYNLFDRLYSNTLRRIHDAELKTASADKFTVAEYLQSIQKACWSEALDLQRRNGQEWSDVSPFISDIRRSLQREFLGLMEPLVRSQPGSTLSPDLHAMTQHSLRQLGQQIERVQKDGELDFASDAHLTACKSRIDRMLAPDLEEYRGSSSF